MAHVLKGSQFGITMCVALADYVAGWISAYIQMCYAVQHVSRKQISVYRQKTVADNAGNELSKQCNTHDAM